MASVVSTNAPIATPSVSWTYDPAYGRVATMIDGTGTTSYTYHPAGQLGAGQVATVDGPLTNDVIGYTYDQLGRVVTRAINGVPLTLTYDPLGRVEQEVNALGTFGYTFDGVSGRLATVTYPNNQTSTYSYLPAAQDHRLQAIHHKYPNGATLSRFDYTYDAVGHIVTWRQQADTTAVLWEYGYDGADQLVRAVKRATDPQATVLQRFAYGYDPAGNRLFEQIDDTVTAWTYDRLNRLVTQQAGGVLRVAGTINEPATVRIDGRPAIVDASGVFVGGIQTVPGTTRFTVTATDASGNTASQAYDVDQLGTPKSFTFDPNGNLTSDGTRTFEWDAWNRLTKLTEATISISYSYDGFSRRASSVSKSGATTTEDTRNVWCGLTLCQIRGAVGAPTLTAIYQFGTVRDGVASHMVRDHLMSAREVTDSAGVLQVRYEFGPWGQRTLTEGSDTTSFGFTGQPSSRTNIWNMTYRDYEATTTRWLNEDPIGLAGGINLYGYVGGNPVSRIDPSGLVSVSRSDPQRINTSTRAIGGACGRYDPNALFLGSCACAASGGFKASLIAIFHPQIYVATNIRTPPDFTYRHEITRHHAPAQALIDAAIREGERIEGRLFSSYEECNNAVDRWVKRYTDQLKRRTAAEVFWDFVEGFRCDTRPGIV